MSIAKQLEKNLGGKWKYDCMSTWWCDDGKRHVSRCSSMFDDEDRCPPQYWLYEDGKAPRPAEEFVNAYMPLPALE
jgi:hypothetical protein